MSFEELIWIFTSDSSSRGVVRLNIAEAALLYRYCKKVKDGSILEIGRKHGGSTLLMADAISNGKLYSIDIIMHECVKKYTEPYKDKIKFFTADSKKIEWDMCLDLVFVDGDHSYSGVKNDINKFIPFVNDGGYMVFHDIVGKKSILQPLIDKMKKEDWKEVDKIDSMLVLQKGIK